LFLFRRADRLRFDRADPIRAACVFLQRLARRKLETRHPLERSRASLVRQSFDWSADDTLYRNTDLRRRICLKPHALILEPQVALAPRSAIVPPRARSSPLPLLAFPPPPHFPANPSHSALRPPRRSRSLVEVRRPPPARELRASRAAAPHPKKQKSAGSSRALFTQSVSDCSRQTVYRLQALKSFFPTLPSAALPPAPLAGADPNRPSTGR